MDPEGLGLCADVIEDLCSTRLGSPAERRGTNIIWRRPGGRPTLVLGHFDTVWPPGTIVSFPFSLEEGVARGPGVFDMKAGIVQGISAIASSTAPVTLLLTSDEEIGSTESRALIEEEAKLSQAVLVLEPSHRGALKVSRKGLGKWRVEVTGRAAHAGLDPERGVNAALELARQFDAIAALARADLGTTVTITTLGGGSAENVVPERAWCTVDARMWTAEEAQRLDRQMAMLDPILADTSLTVTGGINRPPMPREACESLFSRLRSIGYQLDATAVGGMSDGNLTASLGIPTLDGLGAVGGGAHARDEHVILEEMPRRATMVADLLESLARRPLELA